MGLLTSGCASSADAQPAAPGQGAAWAEQCADWDEWDKPGPPFNVWGNTYYVGTCGISAILIVGEKHHVLIDSGTEQGAEVVLANIRALGIDPSDVWMILQSHEHHDHVGGMARIAAATGQGITTNREVWQVYATGKPDPRDPQFATSPAMAPVEVESTIEAGTRLGLGAIRVQAIATPGHTPGALSWQWQSCDAAGVCMTVVYADSLTPVSADGYRFSDHPDYVAAFRASIARVAALDCDILLTPHPSAGHLRDRLLGTAPLIDRQGCRDYAAQMTERLDERLAEEASGG